ncbi:putative protein dehydration-induced 19 [Helianthus anomalus]
MPDLLFWHTHWSEKQQVAGEDQEEKARRNEFVQGLLLSSFLNDDL